MESDSKQLVQDKNITPNQEKLSIFAALQKSTEKEKQSKRQREMKKSRKNLLLRFDRALSNSLLKQAGVLACILVVTLAISFLFLSFSGSDWIAFCKGMGLKPWLLPIYLIIDGNALTALYMGGNVHGWMLFASSLIYLLGVIFFNGMLIAVIVNAIGMRAVNHENGLTHYLNSGHYIVMGYDEMVPSIIEDILGRDKKAYVLLLTAYDVKKVKEWLKKSVARNQMDQIIVNYGQRTAYEYYPEIHLESAAEIYVIGHRSNPAHDAVNIECVDSICNYLKEHKSAQAPKRITCVFEDLDTYTAFKTSEIFEEVKELGMEFVPYNFYAGWARQVFATRSYKEKSDPTKAIPYPCVYGRGIAPDDKKFVHLVFVGTTNFAVSFAMEAAQMLHFPNYDDKTKNPKTRITFIEQNAEKEMAQFITRNRHFFELQSFIYRDLSNDSKDRSEARVTKFLSNEIKSHDFLDVEFEFIKGDAYSKEVQDVIRQWAKDEENQYLSIFLTLAEQRFNFMMGMNMPDEVYDNAIPVFIRQDKADNFVTSLRKADNKDFKYSYAEENELKTIVRKGRYANLYPFGMDDMAYCSDEKVFRQAKLINFLYNTADYSCNRFKDLTALAAMGSDRIWEQAEELWWKLSVALKWSNLYSASNIPCKLASLRVMRGMEADDNSHDQYPMTEEEVHQLAIAEHNRWNVEKLLMGYRKSHGSEDKYEHAAYAKDLKKNKNLFIHHDIRPFEELDDVRLMDHELTKYIPWILKMTENK